MALCKRTISSSEKSPAETSKIGNKLYPCLPRCITTSQEETLFFIERHGLMGRGIGYVDASILASAVLVQANLWSRDKRLMALAPELGCAYSLESSE